MHRTESVRPDGGDGASPELSVLVPAYNEAATIGQVLASLRELPIEHEVIVVDDGSNDGTADIVRGHPDVRLVRHEVNQGKGAAIAPRCPSAIGRGARPRGRRSVPAMD